MHNRPDPRNLKWSKTQLYMAFSVVSTLWSGNIRPAGPLFGPFAAELVNCRPTWLLGVLLFGGLSKPESSFKLLRGPVAFVDNHAESEISLSARLQREVERFRAVRISLLFKIILSEGIG
jgi:hypothetical protein